MGLCASMLPWRKAKRGQQPEPRRGTPRALFVVRNDGRPSKPEALVFHPHSHGGRSGLQKPSTGRTDSRRHDKCEYDCTDVLSRRLRAPKPPRLPCGSARSVGVVEPMMAADEMSRPPVSRGATAGGRAAAAVEGCWTPMTPRRTPVWQRRILMGTRCELPRFSGVILYDEHGRPLQSSSQNRAAEHLISRASKHESKGKKRTARTTTTLRDLL
ncbi:hypothetical protein BAE44_0014338 [Dichanthelium oligosanthes]|uniref:Uncharacterized protein n=1 Tax=Dichanthelium oligosanthes TaxID=888268 RepID=A0A1E5VHW8_9POAL|nr:hypothetical protein BAE44_0014338 [Dichanthelium oligosanthes]